MYLRVSYQVSRETQAPKPRRRQIPPDGYRSLLRSARYFPQLRGLFRRQLQPQFILRYVSERVGRRGGPGPARSAGHHNHHSTRPTPSADPRLALFATVWPFIACSQSAQYVICPLAKIRWQTVASFPPRWIESLSDGENVGASMFPSNFQRGVGKLCGQPQPGQKNM